MIWSPSVHFASATVMSLTQCLHHASPLAWLGLPPFIPLTSPIGAFTIACCDSSLTSANGRVFTPILTHQCAPSSELKLILL